MTIYKTTLTLAFVVGSLFVFGMVISFDLLASGIYNIDSITGIMLQAIGLISLQLVSTYCKLHNRSDLTIYYMTGFCIGTFLGFSFVAGGIWHAITR